MLTPKEFVRIIIFPLLFISINAFSQKVNVTEKDETIETTLRHGLSIQLVLEAEDVQKAWIKKLKEFGKVESVGDIHKVESALITSISPTPVRVISQLTKTDKGVYVFYAIDLGTNYLSFANDSLKYRIAEKILHDFGVMMYHEDINEDIKNAEKVLLKTVSAQEKVVNEGIETRKKIEKNKLQKQQLEQKLKDNAQELINLEEQIEKNKLNQDKAAKDVEKVRKALETTRERLSKVE
jgi:hypothetical protein